MSDYSRLLEMADRNCECNGKSFTERCNACRAASALNECAEIMWDTLVELKNLNKRDSQSNNRS